MPAACNLRVRSVMGMPGSPKIVSMPFSLRASITSAKPSVSCDWGDGALISPPAIFGASSAGLAPGEGLAVLVSWSSMVVSFEKVARWDCGAAPRSRRDLSPPRRECHALSGGWSLRSHHDRSGAARHSCGRGARPGRDSVIRRHDLPPPGLQDCDGENSGEDVGSRRDDEDQVPAPGRLLDAA